jgi:anti-sigma B factor antagonist
MTNQQFGNPSSGSPFASDQANHEARILYGTDSEDIVIVRVVGRATLDLSPQLKILANYMNSKDFSPNYIMDLEECSTMDSTFMGVLATMAMHQIACRKDRLIVINANSTTRRQMDTLGLKHVLTIRQAPDAPPPIADRIDFKMAEPIEVSRLEQIAHMIESHKALIDMNSGNKVKFDGVLQLLNQSLNRAKKQ